MRGAALYSSAAAPVLLIGGWLLAESRQPAAFDPLRDAISDLAAIGAADREIMTVALAGVGLAHLVTAWGLTEASKVGRAVLGVGGAATVLVAVFPLPGGGGSSGAHTAAATTAFVALAVWPFFGAAKTSTAKTSTAETGTAQTSTASEGRERVQLLRPPAAVAAGVVLLGLVGWFGLTLSGGGPLGLAERVAAAAQAIWPLVVVLSLRAWSASGARRSGWFRPGRA